MPVPLSARKPGWLLREHYKNVMSATKERERARRANPKFKPHQSINYNFKRALYRNADLPKIAKLLESEIIDGRISQEHARGLLTSLLSGEATSFSSLLNTKGIEKVASTPRKSIEQSLGMKTRLIAFPAKDAVTGNIVELISEENGNIRLIVKKPKN